MLYNRIYNKVLYLKLKIFQSPLLQFEPSKLQFILHKQYQPNVRENNDEIRVTY